MRQDALRSYVEMALGITEASRKQATKAVKRVLGKGGATTEQLQALAEELIRTSTANREALTKLVRAELDRALGRVGLAKADEVAELTERVRHLEAELAVARAAAAAAPVAAAAPASVVPVVAAEPFGAGEDAVVSSVDSSVAAPGAAEPAAPPAKKATKKVAKKAVRRATPDQPAGAGASTGAAAKKAPARKVAVRKAAAGGLQPSTEPSTGPALPAKKAPARKKAAGTPGGAS